MIDEGDIAGLGSWPLTDETLDRALELIDAGGARVIGLDMYRDTPVPPGSDRLAATFARNGKIYALLQPCSLRKTKPRMIHIMRAGVKGGFSTTKTQKKCIV